MSTTAPTDTMAPWKGVDLDDPGAVLRHAVDLYHPRLVLATSFSIEDNILAYLLAKIRTDVRVVSLDTGRLPEETYECAERMRQAYGLTIEWYHPEAADVEALIREKGAFSFRESVENRKECCRIRKVLPLRRALAGAEAWITGLRAEQSVTRSSLHVVEVDEANGGILKLSPLVNWTYEQAWDYTRKHRIPYNRLYDLGYTSIGCAPCTRAIRPGEDQRAGRWWWENPEHKECGLHPVNYQI